MRWTLLSSGALALAALSFTSCAKSGFASETIVATVRILVAASEPAYAQPGQAVNVQMLAFDGRPSQPEPMTLSWIPFVCENPPNDAYYGCFAPLIAGDAGAPSDGGIADGGAPSGLGVLRPGINLTPLLPSGPSFNFTMPADIVATHTPVPGAPPYGLAILFNVACAGHLQFLPPDPNNPNPVQVPIGCFDSSGNQLGPDDYVLGYTRVYAFPPDGGADGGPITNANPVISSVDVEKIGLPNDTLAVTLEPNVPMGYAAPAITLQHCVGNCAAIPIGPNVPASSQELTQNVDSSGNPQREQIWADFYSTFGSWAGGASLLYDPTQGSIGGPSATDNQFTPPSTPGTGFIWIVVHDDRGGASWVTIPVTVQ